MPSIMVDKSSADYPCLINSRHIINAWVSDAGNYIRVRIKSTNGNTFEYGRYDNMVDALIVLEQLGNLIDLGE